MSLFDDQAMLGGQFNIAKQIPGKEEFYETLRYYQVMLDKYQVEITLNKRITSQELISAGYDDVILATGIKPRTVIN